MSEKQIENEREEREEKGGGKNSLAFNIIIWADVLALVVSSFLFTFDLENVRWVFLIGFWAAALINALFILSLTGHALLYVLFGAVVGFCLCSFHYKIDLTREERKAENAVRCEEFAAGDTLKEGEDADSGKTAAADPNDAKDEEEKKPYWLKHYASKWENDIRVSRKGTFSLYEYSFSGEGEEHTKEEREKYGIPDWQECNYSKVESTIKIAWPELESGLTPAALAKVRRTILWMAFSQVVPSGFIPYDRLKGLGETKESILKYLDIIDTNEWEYLDHYITESAEDGEISNSGNFCLAGFVRSRFVGKLPAKEGDEVGDDCLMASLAFAKQYVNECYECKLESGHQCSRYDFTAQIDLSWPFGLKAKEGAKWYEQPVMCVKYWGYANDGGNGDHSDNALKIYRLPDGEELSFEDYFASDKLKALEALVKQRLISDWLKGSKDGIDELESKTFYLCDFIVREEGMLFKWPVYELLSRPWNSPEVFIEWKDLEPFMNNELASRQDNNKNVDN